MVAEGKGKGKSKHQGGRSPYGKDSEGMEELINPIGPIGKVHSPGTNGIGVTSINSSRDATRTVSQQGLQGFILF